jgi:hypothetical protein
MSPWWENFIRIIDGNMDYGEAKGSYFFGVEDLLVVSTVERGPEGWKGVTRRWARIDLGGCWLQACG